MPPAVGYMGTPAERFAAKCAPPDENGCIHWLGALTKGYGRFSPTSDELVPAHRWAWEQENGPVPDGHVLDHTCHNGTGCSGGFTCMHRRCMNTAHLQPVTQAVNRSRGELPRVMAAMNAARPLKTHCKHGHPFDEENTRMDYRGHRRCRECGRIEDRARRQRQRVGSVA